MENNKPQHQSLENSRTIIWFLFALNILDRNFLNIIDNIVNGYFWIFLEQIKREPVAPKLGWAPVCVLFSREISMVEPKFVFLTLDGMVESDCCCKQNLVISFQLVKFRRAVNIAVPATPRNKQTSTATKMSSQAFEPQQTVEKEAYQPSYFELKHQTSQNRTDWRRTNFPPNQNVRLIFIGSFIRLQEMVKTCREMGNN